MHRFFVSEEQIRDDLVIIKGNDYNHIVNSLRLNPGDKLIVCPGNCRDYVATIEEIKENQITGKIIKEYKNRNEPSLNITLAQALPKKRKMDLVIQKATEIGVRSIIPLKTTRTIVRLNKKKERKKTDRWQKIAKEAAKQSGRGRIPTVERVYSLKELTQFKSNFDLIIIPWEEEQGKNLKNVLSTVNVSEISKILVIIGPEGGFPPEEIKFIEQLGGIPITLGPRILRTETAGLVVLTMLLYESGDLGG
ncbi:conserved hypothetical protein TIGR00046 [Halothermothrix orenii H 168]|uniref:Ribosomal RNA small subunit methyltransferase E n=2 Tax=Halothermothrix orenii TaxID=31909 RepID=B8CXK8_HALOH|nr:conserved hypothetical protein TIGR00046 [Halothermothrix orenii H 168]